MPKSIQEFHEPNRPVLQKQMLNFETNQKFAIDLTSIEDFLEASLFLSAEQL